MLPGVLQEQCLHGDVGEILAEHACDFTTSQSFCYGAVNCGSLCSVFFFSNKNCSHETKRYLLLGRKAMTNLDRILKSRDITFPTKVSLVKAMGFPVVMYGCESWTIKKAEH